MPVAVDGLKVCTGCREELPVARFSNQAALRDGLNPKCKACRKAVADAHYAANRERVIEQSGWNMVKHRYGITRADFEALLERQGGVCAICGRDQTDSRGARLCIDHDHETGEVRGLLCTPCNLAIGYFQDDIQRLADAAVYLRGGSHRS